MRSDRVRKSVDRTLAWAKMQIQQMSAAAVAAAPADRGEDDADGAPPAKRAAVAAPPVPYMFAAVQGGGIPAERARCAAALSALPELCGFALGGFGTGESPTERDTLIRATVAALTPAKPRLISGVGSPEEVLRCVAA
jgi:queuine/archaeosine tRNA-ribosyltransferase